MLAVIGGSGLAQLGNLKVRRRKLSRTPYGEPSCALAIGRRSWQIESLPTLPKGTTPTPEFLARRKIELDQIAAARAASSGAEGWRQHFIWPVTGRISGVFGSQRIYAGEPGAYHSGVDVARPEGTIIVAPADGVVILAAAAPFTLGVDIGGTFTDIVLLGSDGAVHTQKISSSVDNYARAIVEGDDTWRLFLPFELIWAGGRAGRVAAQVGYWWRRNRDEIKGRKARGRAGGARQFGLGTNRRARRNSKTLPIRRLQRRVQLYDARRHARRKVGSPSRMVE